MVKRLTLLLCLLAGGARATVITTTQDTLLSRMTFTASDEIVIRSGDTVYIDSTWSQTTVSLARFFVRQGGALIGNTGKGILVNALWLGGDAAAPYSSANGGEYKPNAQSYLGLRYSATWPKSFTCGANSIFQPSINGGINGTNCAVIYCDNPATYGLAGIYVENTTASFKPRGVRFRQLYPGGFNGGGIDINSSGREASLTDISQCYFDTSNVRFITSDGIRIDTCYFRVPSTGVNQAIRLNGSDNDTIWGCQIYVEGVNQGCKGIYSTNSAAPYIRSSKVWEDQGSVFSASSYGIYYEGSGRIILSCDTLYGFGFTLASNYGGNAMIQVDSSLFYMGQSTHESIISHDASDSILVRSSLFYGRVGGGQSIITAYANSATGGWVGCYYNTFDNGAFGFSPTAFCVGLEYGGSGSVTYNNIDLVGNIMLGRHATYSLAGLGVGPTGTGAVTVNLRQFKDNAYKAVYVKSGSSVSYPYTAADSNKITSAYGFVDSAGGDYRLAPSSSLINCGDSAYAVSVFGSAQASKAPFDIGYYQSYTLGTCGGSSTPTGACCINYVCNTGYTSAQCTSQGGVYQGNGTTTCVSCTAPAQTSPAPMAKQLPIWWLTYRAPWWQTANDGSYSTTLRTWAANRANGMIGANTKADFDSMKVVNPQMLGATYAVMAYYDFDSSVYVQDTTTLKNWCDSMFTATGLWRYKIDSVVLRALGGTFTCDPDQKGSLTTAVGRIGRYNYFGSTSHRYMFDFRNAQTVAEYQWYKQKRALVSAGTTFIMLDEEGLAGTTGRTNAGNGPPVPPFKESSQWSSGFNNFQKPFWTTNFTTLSDSIANLRTDVYAKIVGDSMRANGYHMIPNGAAYWGPHAGNPNNWTNEALETIDNYGGALLGENYAFAAMAGNAGGALGANRHLIGRLHQVKDSGMDLAIWFECGPYDSALAISQRRYKMGALGLMLMGTFPGTTHYYWVPNPGYNYTNFRMPQSGAPQNMAVDTTWLWSYAWGKYFGIPMITRDSSQTGTDNAGQAYTIWKVGLTHPVNGVTDTMTFACGRWYQGANIDTAATRVKVRLPGATSKKWYLLNDNSGASGSAGLASWSSTIYSGGDSVGVGNAHWLVFSSDIALANAGYTGSTPSSTGTASIDDVSVTEGGTMTFTVTLSAAQSVVTTLSYSTSDGTAVGGTDYTTTTGGKPIPIGSTSTTITIPTTNRSGCQASRAFTVTFNVTSPATITVTNPTGTGTILDDDCGTTYGKTYKGKIVIKGNGKP